MEAGAELHSWEQAARSGQSLFSTAFSADARRTSTAAQEEEAALIAEARRQMALQKQLTRKMSR